MENFSLINPEGSLIVEDFSLDFKLSMPLDYSVYELLAWVSTGSFSSFLKSRLTMVFSLYSFDIFWTTLFKARIFRFFDIKRLISPELEIKEISSTSMRTLITRKLGIISVRVILQHNSWSNSEGSRLPTLRPTDWIESHTMYLWCWDWKKSL